MQNKVLSALLILIVVGIAMFFLLNNKQADTVVQNEDNTIVPDVSNDIIWNAYTLNGNTFIYPSQWTFSEVMGEDGKVASFKVENPISSNSNDSIEVGGDCPTFDTSTTNPQMTSICLKNTWMRTESQNENILKVFTDMKNFSETVGAGPLSQ